ncbi:TatD family hydrolase [Candidatus Gracilibacteria bacterium]|nr:TatD family hydrolase [Candidatus Gracilibacteria bacterium]
MLFDTHSHIYMCNKKQELEIIQALKDEDIKTTSIGVDLETSKKSIELALKYGKTIYASIGIHPNDVGKYKDDIDGIFEVFEKLIIENSNVIVGIGETGFDFYHDKKEDKLELQEIFFKKHIFLAKKYSLPIIIHSRNARDDTFRVLVEEDFKNFILHCFGEDLEYASKIIDFSNNCKISFAGNITYKSSINIQNTAQNIPLKNILIETDSPFLTPQIFRGSENYPNYVKYVLEKIVDLRLSSGKKERFNEIEDIIYKNSLEIYGL